MGNPLSQNEMVAIPPCSDLLIWQAKEITSHSSDDYYLLQCAFKLGFLHGQGVSVNLDVVREICAETLF